MENLIEAIRNAVASEASDEARVLGAQACRTILAALETPVGQPLNPADASATVPVASQLQAVVSALRGMPPDQLLDLAIAPQGRAATGHRGASGPTAARTAGSGSPYGRRSVVNAPVSLPTSAGSPCMCAEELARFLGVNRKTVYEYAARNVIPHQRLGRRIVFSREQVVAWLGACRASPAGKAI